MYILFLGDLDNPLLEYLKQKEDNVIQTKDKIDPTFCQTNNIDFIVSYNYPHIIRKNIIDLYPNKIINLHISYLPFNRGAQPNLWSFIDRTQPGITIHHIDVGLDTGNILVQKKLDFDWENDHTITLISTYNVLQQEIQQLFKDNWYWLRDGNNLGEVQDHGSATLHYTKHFKEVEFALTKGWNTSIYEMMCNIGKGINIL